MAYDPCLVERVADALETIGERGIRQKGVFSGRGFLRGSSTFVIVWGDELLVKAPAAQYPALLEQPGIRAFAPGGDRPMSTWIVASAERCADDPELRDWVRVGLDAIR